MLLRESMGVGADGSQKAFPSVDIEAFMKRNKTVIDRDLSDAALNLRSNVNHMYAKPHAWYAHALTHHACIHVQNRRCRSFRRRLVSLCRVLDRAAQQRRHRGPFEPVHS